MWGLGPTVGSTALISASEGKELYKWNFFKSLKYKINYIKKGIETTTINSIKLDF